MADRFCYTALLSDGSVAVMTGVQHATWQQEDGSEGISSVAFADVFALRNGQWRMVQAFGAELP